MKLNKVVLSDVQIEMLMMSEEDIKHARVISQDQLDNEDLALEQEANGFHVPNAETGKAMEELNKEKSSLKRYSSVKDLFKDLEK